MSDRHNSSKSPCTDEFFETTEPILLKFLLHILHIFNYVLDLYQVKILFFSIFLCAKNSGNNFFSKNFRHF